MRAISAAAAAAKGKGVAEKDESDKVIILYTSEIHNHHYL
jgi:hypothetical protein